MARKKIETLYSLDAAATKLRRSRRTIIKAAEGLKPASDDGRVKRYHLKDLIAGLDTKTFAPINPQKAALKPSDQGTTLAGEKAALIREQRRSLEFRNAAYSSEYLRASVVEKVWNEHFLTMREIVLGWPFPVADQIAVACGCDRSMVLLILDEKVRELLTYMSDPLTYEKASSSRKRTISPPDDVELPQEEPSQ